MVNKIQTAINQVEEWANRCGFRLSVEKIQVICFSKKKHIPVELTLYGQPLKQVTEIKFLGVWLDEKLAFSIHIEKLVTKCKKTINLMRCLVGCEWGASFNSLRNILWPYKICNRLWLHSIWVSM